MKVIKGRSNNTINHEQTNLDKSSAKLYLGRIVTSDLYAEKIMELLEPLMPPTSSNEDIQRIIVLGIMAWNFAILENSPLPSFTDLFDQVMKDLERNSDDKEVFLRTIEAKQKQYPNDLNVIKDFGLEELDNKSIIFDTILLSDDDPFEEGLLNDEDDSNDELYQMQFEEGYVNRNAILVRPKASFWNWVKEYDANFEPPIESESSIYLISENDSDKETNTWLKKNFERIFENELFGWYTDESCWPKKRNYKMFTDFFNVEYHSMVMDLERVPLLKD